MSERPNGIHPPTQPGRAAPPARATTISPDVHRFLNVLARVTRRIAEQEQPKERTR